MGSSFKPTIRDVAEQAGVSLATVSYVLSGRNGGSTRISEPTKERVLQAAQSLGYVANHAARGMRRGRTDTVAVVIENLGSPWDRSLAEAAYRVLPGPGYRVVILLGHEAWR
ncbi:LacI family transcriptional regulator, partial [Arthrobacter deserti]|nr:LacI family transcriptional regulator [Arthrobacter deserti]